MTRRNRLLSFGASVALIVLGAVADPLFASIVKEYVEMVECSQRLLHGMAAFLGLAHIGSDKDSLAALTQDPLGNGFPALFVAASDRHLGPFFGKEDRRSFADAGRTACDQSGFIFQSHALQIGSEARREGV